MFGWGAESKAEIEAKAEDKRKRRQEIKDAAERDALRKVRQERLERDMEESGMGESENELDRGGIMVSLAAGEGCLRRERCLGQRP